MSNLEGRPSVDALHSPTPCADAPELFTSTDFHDHMLARDSCATCYEYRDLCRDVAEAAVPNKDQSSNGTYGGNLYVNGRAVVIDARRL